MFHLLPLRESCSSFVAMGVAEGMAGHTVSPDSPEREEDVPLQLGMLEMRNLGHDGHSVAGDTEQLRLS